LPDRLTQRSLGLALELDKDRADLKAEAACLEQRQPGAGKGSSLAVPQLATAGLKGTFFLTQKLLPLIADGGRIVNTSTGLARFTFPGYAAYAAMKGGVEVLTRYMAKWTATLFLSG